MPSQKLPEHLADDRVRRYLNPDEKLQTIAADHGITIPALITWIRRNAPGLRRYAEWYS